MSDKFTVIILKPDGTTDDYQIEAPAKTQDNAIVKRAISLMALEEDFKVKDLKGVALLRGWAITIQTYDHGLK